MLYIPRDFQRGKLESDIFRLLNLDFWTFTAVKELMFMQGNLCKNTGITAISGVIKSYQSLDIFRMFSHKRQCIPHKDTVFLKILIRKCKISF